MAVLELERGTTEASRRLSAISVKNVLYATDFSATSQAALPYATAICHRFGSTLHIAHVLSDTGLLLMTGGVDYISFGTLYEDTNTLANEKIEHVKSRLGGIPTRSYIRHGHVWTNLSRIVDDNRIDLIVVGTRGRTGFGKLLLGSVAEDILRHAPCPVLTIGPKIRGHARLPEYDRVGRALAPVELELQHILYAANFTQASLQVAPVAIAMAEEFEARLTLMHVFKEYSTQEDRPSPIESAAKKLHSIVPKDTALAYAPEIVIEFGSTWQCIVNKAAELETDLIVLGAHPAEHIARLPWSTVPEVVANAPCPVLTVRA